MKKVIIPFFLLIILICFGIFAHLHIKQSQDVSIQASRAIAKKQNVINTFKKIIETNNPEIIAKYVRYPFIRHNPIPDIKDEKELIARYDTLLDSDIRQLILNSEIEDWEEVGYEGIMLYSGVLWIDEEGKLIALNTLTKKEVDFLNDWYENDKKNLHPDIKSFYENVYIFETETYLGRIDQIKRTHDDPHSTYRLSLWNKGTSMSVPPLLIINKGDVKFGGSSDNHTYVFKNNDKTYLFEVTYVGPTGFIPYQLAINQNDKTLLVQKAKIIK